MDSKTKKINQDSMESMPTTRPDYWYWYKDRPLNAPTQTYWNDLTYCMITAFATCTNNVLVDIDWTITRASKWKYKPKEWTPVIPSGVVRIPAHWEYMISFSPELASTTYSNPVALEYQIEWLWGKTRQTFRLWPAWTYKQQDFITVIDSFTEWDELMPKILQNSWWDISWGMTMRVIKL